MNPPGITRPSKSAAVHLGDRGIRAAGIAVLAAVDVAAPRARPRPPRRRPRCSRSFGIPQLQVFVDVVDEHQDPPRLQRHDSCMFRRSWQENCARLRGVGPTVRRVTATLCDQDARQDHPLAATRHARLKPDDSGRNRSAVASANLRCGDSALPSTTVRHARQRKPT